MGGAIFSYKSNATTNISNCIFNKNTADNGGSISANKTLNIYNSTFTNSNAVWGAGIYSYKELNINNSTFTNSKAKYSPAIYAQGNITVENALFKNLHANETAGAIGLREIITGNMNNCTFENTSSKNDGGAINIDGNIKPELEIHIANSKFLNSYASNGGALVQSKGELTIENSIFEKNGTV